MKKKNVVEERRRDGTIIVELKIEVKDVRY